MQTGWRDEAIVTARLDANLRAPRGHYAAPAPPCGVPRLRGGNEAAPARCCLRSGRGVPLQSARAPGGCSTIVPPCCPRARVARGSLAGGGHAVPAVGVGVRYANTALSRHWHRMPFFPLAGEPLYAPHRHSVRLRRLASRAPPFCPFALAQAPHCPSLRDAVVRTTTREHCTRPFTTAPLPTALTGVAQWRGLFHPLRC